MSFVLRVTGRVTDTVMRLTRDGVPVLQLVLLDPVTRQQVVVRIQWADNSHSSQFIAGAQRARYRHKLITLECRNARFKKGKLECEASHLAGVQVVEADQ